MYCEVDFRPWQFLGLRLEAGNFRAQLSGSTMYSHYDARFLTAFLGNGWQFK